MRQARVGVLSALVVFGASCSSELATIPLKVGAAELEVEVARAPEDQRTGLMNRSSLGERAGMLFVYETDRRLTFWMKNTTIPLSIAFVASDGRIVQIEDMEPLSLAPVRSTRSVRYALEVRQGLFEELGVRSGDSIVFPAGFR
jgi:uncharacterized membrane protein (UPF0127 family)